MRKTIEYFYACHSVYAYLGAGRLAEIAAQKGAEIIHRPFDFDPVMAAAGGAPFGKRPKAHMDYFFGRELRRWAEYRDRAMIQHRPMCHDNPLALGNGAIIAAQNAELDADALSRGLLAAHWRDDADLAAPKTLHTIAAGLNMDGAMLLEAAKSRDVQHQHGTNTDEAIARHVIGSPTYFVQGDMFYGQDRLELVARALDTPFAR
ncbi:2-hydroxychromene-2-carboxylate isomerase [Roseobacter fucihabitans]|uniref:2-hydroxychromene-2-carboxylate isomerase n=1 Tax=Roseobacter fucihabitans TaxID=1537242 RepID=A0ABZ2BWL0_9RHOB|nr:2-hydroxychromene-2-carboxylate isomerase [Roseobacter litoralis]MBC6965715.1 2-hydroxychromene-2-carboxylate isomerase [Roseobacter litoralis]